MKFKVWPFVIALGFIAGSFACGNYAFSDMSPTFRFNATLALGVPLALLIGLIASIALAAIRSKKHGGLRFTVREFMILVALIGVWMGTAAWWVRYNFATVYASGYSESRFRRVRIGMTPEEVELLLGAPLRKGPTSQHYSPENTWVYSDPPPTGTIGDNYWRRWVIMNNGTVAAVVDDYYVD